MSISNIFGTDDEGVVFGALIAIVYLFIFLVEYIRTTRAKQDNLRKEQYANAAVWGVMLTMAAAGAVIAPNDPKRRDVSILLTVGAALQLLAFALIWVAPRRSCLNESLPRAPADFALLIIVSLSLRVIIEMKWNGYLPVDRTGDGCIQFLELFTLIATLYGLRRGPLPLMEVKRFLQIASVCALCGNFCYGELDGTPLPDKIFATSIYCEFAAWVCMFRYVYGRGREAVNSMFLPPIFVQALCRGYFWYMASPETKIRTPVSSIQATFPWVLFGAHAGMAILALAMSAMCVREFNPALPHKLFSADDSFIV